MKYPRLTPEDEKVFLGTLLAIWDMVGMDCLAATADERCIKTKHCEGGYELRPYEQVTLPRTHVICIVTDMFCSRSNVPEDVTKEQYQRIRDWMRTTPSHIVDKVVKQAFTYKRYGA